MSNFGQAFQNAGFDPSILYQLPNNGGNVNPAALSGMGGGVDQNQQQQGMQGFNLSNAAISNALGGNTNNVGGATASGGGALPTNWLNSFNSLQSHASQQLNQQQGRQQQPTLGQQNPGQTSNLMGSAPNQFDLLRMQQAVRAGVTNAGGQTANPAVLAQQIQHAQQQLQAQRFQAQQQQQQQQAQQQIRPGVQPQMQQQNPTQLQQNASQEAAKTLFNAKASDLSGLSAQTLNNYASVIQKGGMATPEMRAAMHRLQQVQMAQANKNAAGGSNLGGVDPNNNNAPLMTTNPLPSQAQAPGLPQSAQTPMTDAQRREVFAKRLQSSGLSQAQLLQLAQQRAAQGQRLSAGNLAQLQQSGLFGLNGQQTISPIVQQQLLNQLKQSQQQSAQLQANQNQQQSQQQQPLGQQQQPQMHQQLQQQRPQQPPQPVQQPQQPNQQQAPQPPPQQPPQQQPPQQQQLNQQQPQQPQQQHLNLQGQSMPTMGQGVPMQNQMSQGGQDATGGIAGGAGPWNNMRQAAPVQNFPPENDWMRVLRSLHQRPDLQYPTVNGKEVNLYRLFAYVFAYGGYRKFDSQPIDKMWTTAAQAIGFLPSNQPGVDPSTIARQISEVYHQFLSRLEELWMQNLQGQRNQQQQNAANQVGQPGAQQQPGITQGAVRPQGMNQLQAPGQQQGTPQQTSQQLPQQQPQQPQEPQQPQQPQRPQQPQQQQPQPQLNMPMNAQQPGQIRPNMTNGLTQEFMNAVAQNQNMTLTEEQQRIMKARVAQAQSMQQQRSQQSQQIQQNQQNQQLQQAQQTPQQNQQTLPTPQSQQQSQQATPQQSAQPSQPQLNPHPVSFQEVVANLRMKEAELEAAFLNTRKQTVQIPPDQQNEYRSVLESVVRLATEAKQRSPLFSVVAQTHEDRARCNGLVQLSAICSAAVNKAKSNQPCLTLKELEGVRNRLKLVIDQASVHLQQAMTDPNIRKRMQSLTNQGISNPNEAMRAAAAAANAAQATNPQQQQQPPQQQAQQQQQPQLNAAAAMAAANSNASSSNQNNNAASASNASNTPQQQTHALSPEMLNNLIKRPLKQEDLKPPPLPKSRKSKVSESPKPPPTDVKTPRTPAAASTPQAEASTPSSSAPPKRAPKRKSSVAATPKSAKRAKADEDAQSEKAPTPAAPTAPTPQNVESAPTPGSTSGATPAAAGFSGNAINVSRATHADYFAQQQKGAAQEREQAAAFFASRQGVSSFDGDINAAMNMWTSAQQFEPTGPAPPPPLGDNTGGLTLTAQTDDALADQSWHDFINEQNFDPDEPTPLLTRCRSLDTDPECSPRDGDILGRSPLTALHAVHPGMFDPNDKGATRRIPLMSPSAQLYNGMLFVNNDIDHHHHHHQHHPGLEPFL